MQIQAIDYLGFQAYKLSTSAWEAVCVPERGANIPEFRHLTTGRQWLWVNPREPLARHDYGCPYGWSSASGFDECFPAIAPGLYPLEPYKRREIPDHGELWSLPWSAEVEDGSLRTWIEGRNFPYRFERTISEAEDDGAMLLHYKLTNLADAPLAYNWSAHPVFVASEGMIVHIEPGTTMRVEESLGDRFGNAGTRFPWPGGEPRLERIPGCGSGEVRIVKLLAENLTRNWVGLYHPESDSHLALRFNLNEIDMVGVWINVCEAPGEDRVAIEPCKGNTDSLAGSLEEGTASFLGSGEVQEWSLWLQPGVGPLDIK
jgi:galactose mutarotase-like enzyme